MMMIMYCVSDRPFWDRRGL